MRRYAGAGAQNLGLLGDVTGAGDAGNDTGAAGASLPTLANNTDFSTESIAVSGQAGTTNPFAGVDVEQLRQNAELNPSPSRGPAAKMQGPGARAEAGQVVLAAAEVSAGRRLCGGGRGRARWRLRQLSKLQAQLSPTALCLLLDGRQQRAQCQPLPDSRPAAAAAQLCAEPVWPNLLWARPTFRHLVKHDTRDILFFNLSGQRSSSPFDQYGTVPTADERAGDLSALTTTDGGPLTIYDPATGLPFPGNVIPTARIPSQATALLNYVPLPNLSGQLENYQRLTSTESNSTRIGVRFMRNLGANNGGSPFMGMIRQYLGQGGPGLRQSINFNFNLSHPGLRSAQSLSRFGRQAAVASVLGAGWIHARQR